MTSRSYMLTETRTDRAHNRKSAKSRWKNQEASYSITSIEYDCTPSPSSKCEDLTMRILHLLSLAPEHHPIEHEDPTLALISLGRQDGTSPPKVVKRLNVEFVDRADGVEERRSCKN